MDKSSLIYNEIKSQLKKISRSDLLNHTDSNQKSMSGYITGWNNCLDYIDDIFKSFEVE